MQSSSTIDRVGQMGAGGVKTRANAAADELRTPGAPLPPLRRPLGSLGSGLLVPGAVRLIVALICPGCLSLC